MWYLFLQVWFLLLISFILGWTLHWFLCCRGSKSVPTEDTTPANAAAVDIEIATDPGMKPPTMNARPENVDDLKRIKGVGNVIEKTLNELGIFNFAQIAAWNQSHVLWIENYVAFPGRVKREEWVAQAKTLDSGGTTEFAKRVDSGELSYDGKD